MKVVILAGGFGTRLSEETDIKPKPMVEIGGKPILWHIMKIYSSYGFNDFVICCGYKGYVIKEYFTNYYNHMCDITVDLTNGDIKVHKSNAEPWQVTLVDTGLNTLTGGRIKRIKEYVGNEPFMLTYGDGVSDVNIKKLLKHHNSHNGYVSVTSVKPSGRFGALNINEEGQVSHFIEKPAGDGAWINGGFFVCEPEIFDYIDGDETIWERKPLETLAKENKLFSYKHEGFWQPMDTLRDKNELESLWVKGEAPWQIWK
ncbi:glucose-1-phosphate cytidylyltransferase [Clostridium intestinale]|uniref:Glucose-1-phosphate cytidylyltransferase n=1 Tax=Clostridium intestinale TaxID=36845 RepID=A0A7D6VPJ9_9CLOT|nr:glucose-1-phosphate cytidylyltransferase [Clostridium intestinale]QLY79126.1 glucose-1-phosphate cytidylyltransferase [Clostridium intestinale]